MHPGPAPEAGPDPEPDQLPTQTTAPELDPVTDPVMESEARIRRPRPLEVNDREPFVRIEVRHSNMLQHTRYMEKEKPILRPLQKMLKCSADHARVVAFVELCDDIDPAIEGATPPREFLCPLSLAPMHEPVIAHDGIVYERAYIERHLLTRGPTSPVTRQTLRCPHLFPARAITSLMQQWADRVAVDTFGAPEKMNSRERMDHATASIKRVKALNSMLEYKVKPK